MCSSQYGVLIIMQYAPVEEDLVCMPVRRPCVILQDEPDVVPHAHQLGLIVDKRNVLQESSDYAQRQRCCCGQGFC